MILAEATKQLSNHWQTQCGYRTALQETFVEKSRFEGAGYKAANEPYLGQTKERSKLGSVGKQRLPIKDLRAYPLDVGFRAKLTS